MNPLNGQGLVSATSRRPSVFGRVWPYAVPISWLLATIFQSYILMAPDGILPDDPYTAPNLMLLGFTVFMTLLGGLWTASRLSSRSCAAETRLSVYTHEQRPLLCTEGPIAFEEKHGVVKTSYTDVGIAGAQDASSRAYVPYFVWGNMCTATWAVLLVYGHDLASQIVLVANLVIQTYVIFIVIHSWRNPTFGFMNSNWCTHLLPKGNAALAFLLLWNQSGMLEAAPPALPEMLNSAIIFLLMAVGAGPDPTMGVFLLYDLAALISDTPGGNLWRITLQYTALCVTFVMAWDMSGLLFCEGSPWVNGVKERRVESEFLIV